MGPSDCKGRRWRGGGMRGGGSANLEVVPKRRHVLTEATAIGGGYCVLATAYIVFSDQALALLTTDPDRLVQYGTYKGVAFVLATAIGLFAVWFMLAGRAAREHERRETALRRLEAIGRALPSPLFVNDPEGGILEWNNALEAVSGYTAAQLAGMTIADLAYPYDLALARRAIERILRTGQPDVADVRLATADGRALLHRWHGAPIREASGAIQGIVVVGVDLTDIRNAQEDLKRSLLRAERILRQTVDTLGLAIEKRGAYTAGHERRVAALALALADELGLPDEERAGLEYAALLHDLGEIAVPADILVRPARLSDSELAIVRTHAEQGYEILREVDFPWPVADIVHQHHERLDGSGYPRGLAGSAIRLEARIIGVADVVEAMCSHRPYRPALGMPAALDELRDGRGVRYDAAVVDACLTVCRGGFEFPVHSY
ncbi:MAG: HD domain-containing phosphohydrolase [Thalassobaculum sp.]|uniref:HD domain-containing phosphohydrolase n=1 Tax=Thalassobaculum sp. TaxID=2022740 RepID=UPI0032F081CB